MSGLGEYLRDLRGERGLSIEEMARITRVASRYLEALEREDFADLPAPVFTKGYIRAYCQALGVASDEALARYAGRTGLAPALPAPSAPTRMRASDDGRRARGTLLVSFVLLVGFGIALFVVALFLQSGRPEIGPRRADRSALATEPRPADRPLGGAEALTVPSANPAPATPPPPPIVPRESVPPSVVTAAEPSPMESKPASPTEGQGTGIFRSTSGGARQSGAAPRVTTDALRGPASVSRPAPDLARGPVSAPRPGPEASRVAASAPRPAPDAPRVTADAGRPVSASSPAPPAEAGEVPTLHLGGVDSPYRLVVRASEPTWLRVRTEDGRATEETIPAGAVREWVSNRPFVLTVGNAGGATFELNGRKLPPLGGRGAVIGRLVLPPPEP